jgi:hypothetical protein
MNHPYGVLPEGNALLVTGQMLRVLRRPGLGLLFAMGADAKFCSTFLSLLDARDLCRLSAASRALYIVIHSDFDLFRDLALASPHLEARLGKWSTTSSAWKSVLTGLPHLPLDVRGAYYSDYLSLAWQCSSSRIEPSWLTHDNVERVHGISTSEFVQKFEMPRKPVVITGFEQDFARGIARWKHGMQHVAASGAGNWRFRAGPVTLPLDRFAEYTTQTTDESPLYIFDSRFAHNYAELGEDYRCPEVFAGGQRDLFELLGPARRPDYRWLIAGVRLQPHAAPPACLPACLPACPELTSNQTGSQVRLQVARGPELHARMELLARWAQALADASPRGPSSGRARQPGWGQRGSASVVDGMVHIVLQGNEAVAQGLGGVHRGRGRAGVCAIRLVVGGLQGWVTR